MKTIVVGVWGEGTSLLAEIIRQHGLDLGTGWHGPDKRNKHGLVEDVRIAEALRDDRQDGELFARRLAELDGFKHPRILTEPWTWSLIEAHPFRVVWLFRPSKPEAAYTMLASLQTEACLNRHLLRTRWADRPGHVVFFEDLLEEPEAVIRELAHFLGVAFNHETVELVDPSWPRAERVKAGIREVA